MLFHWCRTVNLFDRERARRSKKSERKKYKNYGHRCSYSLSCLRLPFFSRIISYIICCCAINSSILFSWVLRSVHTKCHRYYFVHRLFFFCIWFVLRLCVHSSVCVAVAVVVVILFLYRITADAWQLKPSSLKPLWMLIIRSW